MKEIISKELLSEVLNYKYNDIVVDSIQIKGIRDNYLSYTWQHGACEDEPTYKGKINIHKLVFKLEMWAYMNQNIRLIVWFDEITSFCEIYDCHLYAASEVGSLIKTIDNQCSKQDIIIEACQWILENKK